MSPEAIENLELFGLAFVMIGFPLALGYIGGALDPIITLFGMKPRSFDSRDDRKKKP